MRTQHPSTSLILVIGTLGAFAVAGCSGTDEAGGIAGLGAGGSVIGAGGSAAGGSGGGLIPNGGAPSAGGGSGATAGGDGAGCNKIDFLFIVDNSVSMQDNQKQLVTAFPGFISAIESTINAKSDHHILVTDTDEWGRCSTANPWTGMNPTSSTCNDYIKTTVFEDCDRTRGAGVVHPAGAYASNKVCPFPDARRYLQQGDPNLASNFECAAQVGTAGHPSERPMDSMLGALSTQLNSAGGCNDGFLRDDALLVITFISDDGNYEDTGTPQDWYNAVVAAKHGDPNAVVVVGIIPGIDGCSEQGTTHGAHWAEFISKFPNSLAAAVCTPDYASIFAQAVTVIDTGCDAYVPPIR